MGGNLSSLITKEVRHSLLLNIIKGQPFFVLIRVIDDHFPSLCNLMKDVHFLPFLDSVTVISFRLDKTNLEGKHDRSVMIHLKGKPLYCMVEQVKIGLFNINLNTVKGNSCCYLNCVNDLLDLFTHRSVRRWPGLFVLRVTETRHYIFYLNSTSGHYRFLFVWKVINHINSTIERLEKMKTRRKIYVV